MGEIRATQYVLQPNMHQVAYSPTLISHFGCLLFGFQLLSP